MSRNNIADAESFFETASKEELINYLVQTIQKEVSKGDDADCDLVRECSDWLEELTEDEIVFTPEELEQKLAELKAGSVSEKPAKIRKKPSPKTFVRVALIAAVIFSISLVSLSALAVNMGYGSAWEFIVANVGRMLYMNDGEIIGDDSISFIKYSKTSNYSSIEDLLISENINILYPKMLPDEVKITKVYHTEIDTDNYILSLRFSDSSYFFDVTNYYSTDFTLLDQTQIIECNGLEYFITQKEESIFLALLQYNGYEYTIQSISYDDLLVIINSMRG